MILNLLLKPFFTHIRMQMHIHTHTTGIQYY